MKKTDTLHQENQKILQEHSGLQQLVKAKMKKIKLRRVIAILSCFVLLLTLNQLKFEADTLQRLPSCNLESHVHTESCYQDGELICGLPEHEHTDACYQQRPVQPEPTVFDEFMDLNSQVVLASPSDEDAEVSVEDVDEDISETTIELGDDGYSDVNDDSYSGLEVEMDLDDLYDEEQADDGNDEPSIDSDSLIDGDSLLDGDSFIDNEPSKENEAVYTMPGDSVTFLSDVLTSVGLSLSGITSVGEIVEDGTAEAHISIEAVEGVDGEYVLRVVKDFDRITLGVITDSDIVEIVLKDGVAAATDGEETGESEAVSDLEGEEYGDDTGLDDEYQQTVESVIENEEIGNIPETTETELKQTEVDEEQTEVGDSDLTEEAASALVSGDPTLVEDDITSIEAASTEAGEAVSEDEASEDAQDASDVEELNGGASAIEDAQGEEATDDSSVKDEDEKDEDAQSMDSQSEDAAGDTSVKDEETTESEEKQDADKQDADEGEQTDEEKSDEEQTEEDQTDDEAKDSSDEEVEDAADRQTEDELQVGDGSEAEDEQQGDAEQSEDEQQTEEDQQSEDEQQGDAEQADDEQTVIRRHVSLDFSAYIVADSHTVYLYDDVMNAVLVNTAEIDSVDGVVVAAAAEEAPTAEEAGEPTEDESGEDEADGEAQEVGAQAEPVEDNAQAEQKARVLIITGDGEYKLDGTAYAVSGLVLPGDEEAVEEPSDAEEDETEPSADDETAEEEPSEGEPAADQAPVVERVVVGYKLEYDLSEVEVYPISLRALMDQAEPVYEEVVIEPGVSADEEEAADNGEADATDGEDAADGDETVDGEHVDADAVTEDTAVEETVDAAPAVEDVALEETADAETAVADAAEEVIEYDTALLTVEQTEEDWLITPAADFEEAQVIIGLYDIIFLNGKAPITYPAMVFDGATEYINVHVEAPEGAFPEGTTMHLEDVEDEQALTEIGDAAVTDDDFVEVQRVHAVDITFQDVDGQEIEPLLPINVVMTLREIEQDEEAVVVHMNDAGETEVVNTTLPTEEMPVETVPFGEAETGAEESAQTEESAQPEESADQPTNSAPGEIAFTTDAFSIYGMVVTKKIETKYIPATGETYKIVVSYGPEAMIPAGATLEVSEIEGEDAAEYLARTEEALDNTKAVAAARFFNIRIMYEGEEVQPAAPVKVQVMLEELEEDAAEDAVPCAVHFADEKEEIPEIVDAVENGEAIEFNAPSFSVWGVVYTVDFHYEVNGQTYTFTLPGGGFARLSDLIVALGVGKNTEEEPTTEAVAEEMPEENDDFDAEYVTPFETVAPVISEETRKFLSNIASVTFSDPALLWVGKVEAASTAREIKAENSLVCQYSGELTEEQIDLINAQEIEAGDWALVSLLPFTSNEALTVTMDNGDTFTVLVTDTQQKFISDYADLDGKEYALVTVKTVKDSNWNDVNAVVLPVDRQTANDDNDRLKAEGRAENNLTVTTPTWKFEKAGDAGMYYISSGGKYLNINRTEYDIGRNDVDNIGDVTLTDTPVQALYAVPYIDGSIAIQNTDGYRLDFWNNNLDHGFGAYKNSWENAQEHQRFKLVPIFKVEEGKPFVIYHKDQDGNYRVLGVNKDNKICQNEVEMDALPSTYKWVFRHRYDENGEFYYEIYSASDPKCCISLTSNGDSYIGNGGSSVVVNAWDNGSDASEGIQLSFMPNGYSDPVYLKHEGGTDNFFYAWTANLDWESDANQTKMFLYGQKPLNAFNFTVRSEDPAKGTVWDPSNMGAESRGVDSFNNAEAISINGETDKKNKDLIKAIDGGYLGENGQYKYTFEYWDLNGERISQGADISAGDLVIPESGAVLTAHFKRNRDYVADDDHKDGRFIDKKSLKDWLIKIKSTQMPLDPNACGKTAELYDYENRIYRVDLTSRSSLSTFSGTIDLGFIIDVSPSMKFPSKLDKVDGMITTGYDISGNVVNIRNINEKHWVQNNNGQWNEEYWYQTWGFDTSKQYYLISDDTGTATVYLLHYKYGNWYREDASTYILKNSDGEVISNTTKFKEEATISGGTDNNFTYQIYIDGDNGKKRSDYLELSISETIGTLQDILNIISLSEGGDKDPQVKLAWNTFKNYLPKNDDNTYRNPTFTSVKDGITLRYLYEGGGTSTDIALLDAAGFLRSDVENYDDYYDEQKYKGWRKDTNEKFNYVDYNQNGFNWENSATKYAVLITDGAPQRSGKSVQDKYVEEAAEKLKVDRDVTLITVGLGMGNVKKGRRLLYNIASTDDDNEPYFYSAETGDELEYVLYGIIKEIMKPCDVYGKVTDKVGDAFYPVNKSNGKPLVPGNWINLQGELVSESYTGAHGVIGLDSNGNYTVTWTNQEFSHAETGDCWHGTVYVKAKEDFLGGNDVKTNEGNAVIEAQKYRIKGTDETVDLKSSRDNYTFTVDGVEYPSIYKTTIDDLKSPRVNVNELNFTENSTEWTVYVGTNVDPLPQIKALYDQIKIEEVITANNSKKPEQVLDENSLRFTVEESESDARTPTGTPVTFCLKDLIKKLEAEADQPELDWDELIRLSDKSGDDNTGITYRYDIYTGNYSDSIPANDRDYPGTINIKLVKTIVDEDLRDPFVNHPANIVGSPVERYTLKVSFSPDYEYLPANQKGNGLVDYHTGLWGLGQPGAAAGTETSNNNHIINVLRKAMELRKVNDDGEPIDGASFKIYKKDASGDEIANTVQTVPVKDGVYTIDPVMPDVDTSVPGSYWKGNTTFYIQETQTPDADYTLFDGEIAVNLAMSDQVTYLGDGTQTYPYNWTQIPTLTARGNADHVTVGYLEKYYIDPTGNQTGRVEETIGIIVAQKNELDIDIDVIKTDADNSPLAGAIFKLKKGGTLLRSGDYRVVKRGTTDAITIDSNGCFEIPIEGVTLKGLGVGTYTLTEVVAPSRYVLSRHPVTFTIQSNADRTKRVTFENTVEAPENTGDGEPEAEGEDEPGSSSDPGSPTDAQIAASRSLTIPNQPMTEFKVVKDWGENAYPNSKQAIVYELYQQGRDDNGRVMLGTFMLNASGGYMLDTSTHLIADSERQSTTAWTMSHFADTSDSAPQYWYLVKELGLYTVDPTDSTKWTVTTVDEDYLKINYKAEPRRFDPEWHGNYEGSGSWDYNMIDLWDAQYQGTPQLTIRNLGALKLTKLVTVNEGDPASLSKPLKDAADGDYYFSIVGPVTRYVYICISGGRMQYYSVLHPEDEDCTLDWTNDNSVYNYDWVNGNGLDWTYWGQYRVDESGESCYDGQWSGYTDNSERFAIIGDLPVGEYVITERRPSNGTTLASITGGKLYEDQNGGAAHNNANLTNGTVTVDVAAGETFDATGHVSVTYTNNKNTGALKLLKLVTYNGTNCNDLTDSAKTKLDGDYIFSIVGPDPSTELIWYVKIHISDGEQKWYSISKENTADAWEAAEAGEDPTDSWDWINSEDGEVTIGNLVPGDYVITELTYTSASDVVTTMNSIEGGKQGENGQTDADLAHRTVTAKVTAEDNFGEASEAYVIYDNGYWGGNLDLLKKVEASTNSPVGGDLRLTNGSYKFKVEGPVTTVEGNDVVDANGITKYVQIYATSTQNESQGTITYSTAYKYEIKDSDADDWNVENAQDMLSTGVRFDNLKDGTYVITELGHTLTLPEGMSLPSGTEMVLKTADVKNGATGVVTYYNNIEKKVKFPVNNSTFSTPYTATFVNRVEPNTATVRKMVLDTNDSSMNTPFDSATEHTWSDTADFDIGDHVPYRVTAFLPQAAYKASDCYYFKIEDAMQNLRYVNGTGHIYVFVKGPTQQVGAWYDVTNKVDGTSYGYFTIGQVDSIAEEHYLPLREDDQDTLTFLEAKTLMDAGLKAITLGRPVINWGADTHSAAYDRLMEPELGNEEAIEPANIQYVQLRYDAELLGTAIIGGDSTNVNHGNANDVKLYYGNDGQSTGWDRNRVFTYQLQANKKDDGNHDLTGSSFQLYKKYKSYTVNGEDWYQCTYTDVNSGGADGTLTLIGTELPDDAADKTPITAGTTFTNAWAQVPRTGTDPAYSWVGIDDGDYRLVEVTHPTGYHGLPYPIGLDMNASHVYEADNPGWRNGYVNVIPTSFSGFTSTNSNDRFNGGLLVTNITNTPYEGISLKKVDESTRPENEPADANTRYLDGAEFTLSKWNGSNYVNYVPAIPTGGAAQSAIAATANGGVVSYGKIEPGEYRIQETRVPDGYVKLLTNDIYFSVTYPNDVRTITRYTTPMTTTTNNQGETVEEKRDPSDIIPTESYTQSNAATFYVTYGVESDTPTFTVGNTPGARLPNSGGPGTTLFYVVGSIITLLAAVLLVTKRRSNDGE